MLAVVAVERGPASAQQPIGAARIVINKVDGTLPSGPGRVALYPNVGVVQNEVIDTAADGTTLIVFSDNTQLSVCPSSEIALNRAELDQAAGRSTLDVTLPIGCVRFASGLLLKTAYFATPTATIRSTGTILTITVSARGATTVSVEDGVASVIGAGRAVTVGPGQSSLVLRGAPPTPPAPTPPVPPIVSKMKQLLEAALVPNIGTRAAARSPAVEAPTDAGTRIYSPNIDGKIQSEIANDATPGFCGAGGSRGTGSAGSRGTHGPAGSCGTR
jgi:hypothetical protein